MKNILLVLIVCLVALGSCKESNEDKAKKLIKEYVQKNANDPNSYESVELEKIDTLFSSYWDDSTYQELFQKQFSYNDSIADVTKYMDSMSVVVQEYEKNFKGEPLSLMAHHRYRANTSFGAKVLNSSIFYFDLQLTRIDSVKNF